MEQLTVRLATELDCKTFTELLKKEHNYSVQKHSFFKRQEHNKVFVALWGSRPAGLITVGVADSGTTLIVTGPLILKEHKDKKISSPLLEIMYENMMTTYKHLARERFLHVSEDGSKAFGVPVDPLKIFAKKDGAQFKKVFQLEKIVVPIKPDNRLRRYVDELEKNSTLVALSKAEACEFIAENSLMFAKDTIVIANQPYFLLRSNPGDLISDDDASASFAVHKPQGLPNIERNISGYESDSSTSSIGSSDSFKIGQRRRSSTPAVESLHTSLRGITNVLRRVHENLQLSMPKSFSHGRVIPTDARVIPSTGSPVWEAMIYCEDSSHVKGHVAKQLKAALQSFKVEKFVFRVYHNSCQEAKEVSANVKKMLSEQLNLSEMNDAQPMILYERAFK